MAGMENAAARHKRCAQLLRQDNELGEACYLIGLAAECAVKHLLAQRNFRFHARQKAKLPDPHYLHFPDLATEVMAQGEGILAGRVLAKIAHASVLQGWSVKMRYCAQPSNPAARRRYTEWLAQTEAIFEEAGI